MSRPFGSKNKTGAQVKAQMLACYERLGGLEGYTKWAKEHQSDFYRQYAALAPKEVHLDARVIEESSLTDAELAAIATASSEGAAEEASSPPDPTGIH